MILPGGRERPRRHQEGPDVEQETAGHLDFRFALRPRPGGTLLARRVPAGADHILRLGPGGCRLLCQGIGGIPLLSKPELSEVAIGEQFDVIWVGSLFTHVDRERTQRWLNHLCAALAPDGILAATFHGRWTIEVQEKYHHMIDDATWQKVMKQYDAEGYGFASYPSMASSRYGISMARASNIVQMVEDRRREESCLYRARLGRQP